MKLKIWIYKEDKLGVSEEENTLADLHFVEKHFNGFWVDPQPNEDGRYDIAFYVSGREFRTPYTAETYSKFKSLSDVN